MPIKFRCIHCGQYLGISRSKAGTIVDCPTCGRSMGVPLKDGEAQRVGRPSLNHDDAELAEALREVAAIAQSSEQAIPQLPQYDSGASARETREVHMPPPKIIPMDPLPPVERIDPPAKPESHSSVDPAGEEADFQADPAEETLLSKTALKHLASLAQENEPEDDSEPILRTPSRHGQWSHMVPWKLWLAFIAVGFSALICGFLLGRWDRQMRPPANIPIVPTANADTSPEAAAPDVFSQLGRPAARGKVEYSQGQGSAIEPDAGAWVFAFPVENKTGVKIPAEQFESDSPQIASALQALGGNAVQADAQGEFQLPLLHPGNYLVLIRSQHKTDATGRNPSEVLNQYFENPEAFLGIRAFQERELEFPGETKELSLETF